MLRVNETLTLSIHLPWIYSENIRMLFRLEKCVQIVVKRGIVVKTDGVELPAGHNGHTSQLQVPWYLTKTKESQREGEENSNIQVPPKDKTDPDDPAQ